VSKQLEEQAASGLFKICKDLLAKGIRVISINSVSEQWSRIGERQQEIKQGQNQERKGQKARGLSAARVYIWT
jgi:hypothetical protein